MFMGASLGALAAPALLGQGRPRLVVVGGGAGGATLAREVAQGAAGAIDVTLVEPARLYHPAAFSNLPLGGLAQPGPQAVSYAAFGTSLGITVIHDWALPIKPDRGTVQLASGGEIGWDRLVLAPGIDFVAASVPGWDLTWQGVMPHGWRGGAQVEQLRRQILAMPDGGIFCLVAPAGSIRAVPAVYERVSLIGSHLHRVKPRAKLLLLDLREEMPMAAAFSEAWDRLAPGTVERLVPGRLALRPESMEIVVEDAVQGVDVCNVIPAQRAGMVAEALLGPTGYVPVNAWNLQCEDWPAIYVLGDAAETGLPRSAAIAQAQARAAASVILSELTGSFTRPPDYTDPWWPVLAEDEALRLVTRYLPDGDTILVEAQSESAADDPAELRAHNRREGVEWYGTMIAGMIGS
ncbi:FAD-dependent oxidoreductase [Plastorhodobacter daqingensis]|uniref:FAD-dependent oxidoreductase n=2 Tax=Plastorhodobacter daqingensis TaxID=1387281 RepID=A0ABW2UK95_9RHOB